MTKKMNDDQGEMLAETLIESIRDPGWRKVIIGCGKTEILALEEFLSRQGKGFAKTSKDLKRDVNTLDLRRVIILIEPRWKR